jgi:long-chain fatty acid transport protein
VYSASTEWQTRRERRRHHKTNHEEKRMTHRFRRTRVAAAIGSMTLALAAGQAFGAAFALQEQSGSGLGNAFAGGAASAEDASTVWSNPAGMSRLTSAEVVTAVHFITPSFKFKNDGSAAAAFQPLGGTGGDAGSTNIVPNLYITYPVNRQLTLGLGVNAPFGLVSEYDSDFLGRFQGIKSDVKTINVNPAISWRVNDQFSVALGVDWQRVDAEFTSAVNYSAALGQAAQQAAAGGLIPPSIIPTILGLTPGLQAGTRVKGDDSAWGWNVGALWEATPSTRVGAHYRSSIKYHVTANVSFDKPALPALPPTLAPVVAQLAAGVNGVLADGGVTSNIELPAIANVSIFSKLNDRWDVMGDIQYTKWSSLKDLTFVRTTGAVLQSTPENFDDVWRYSFGATYHWNDAWAFRGGVAFDQSPVNNTDRTVRLPDSDRTWLTGGVQYKINRNLKLDGGFAYIWLKDGDINQNAGSTAANGLVKGKYESSVTIFSAQLTYTF